MAAKTKNNDPDILTYDEAMRSPDRAKWMEAAANEINELIKQGTWVEVPLSNAKSRILPGTWTFKIKRTSSRNTKAGGAYAVTYRRKLVTTTHLLLAGAPFACSLSYL